MFPTSPEGEDVVEVPQSMADTLKVAFDGYLEQMMRALYECYGICFPEDVRQLREVKNKMLSDMRKLKHCHSPGRIVEVLKKLQHTREEANGILHRSVSYEELLELEKWLQNVDHLETLAKDLQGCFDQFLSQF